VYIDITSILSIVFDKLTIHIFLTILKVSLELLRQEKSVVSAYSHSEHFDSAAKAEREFQRRSIRDRRKFDREGGTYDLGCRFFE